MSLTPRRDALLPHMPAYEQAFSDSGDVDWEPYTIFFHPPNYASDVVNTDDLGFRLSRNPRGESVSVGHQPSKDRVNLVAGSSTAFGIGASSDDYTLASLLSAPDRSGETWLNFAGRSFNSIQEYMLAALHQHRLRSVDRIILLSGFNNLGLSRQPSSVLDSHCTFFMRHRFESLRESPQGRVRALLSDVVRPPKRAAQDLGPSLSLAEQIPYAVDTVARSLDLWAVLARHLNAELTFVLQPLANWVRQTPCDQEAKIFAELDEVGGFTKTYGQILTSAVHEEYSAGLERAAKKVGVKYLDSVPAIADRLAADDWAYVDRIHFTDSGHVTFADLLHEAL